MISIIIPAYNEERYLPATLAAVRRALGGRGEEGFEIVVVDNDSTDDTCESTGEASGESEGRLKEQI